MPKRISSTVSVVHAGLAHLGELPSDTNYDVPGGVSIGNVYSDEPFDTLKATNKTLAEWIAVFHEDPISICDPYQFVTNLTYRLSIYSFVYAGYAEEIEVDTTGGGFVVASPRASSG